MNTPTPETRQLKPEFVEMIESMHEAALDGLCEAIENTTPSVSVRLNPRKPSTLFQDCSQVPWCKTGRYLDERPSFTRDPALHQGLYYVQDASSMFVAHAVNHLADKIGERPVVLDACASPGGKTTAGADILPPESLIIANEYMPARAEVLKENLIKWGLPNCIVTRGDTARYRKLHEMMDIVLVDAPCSGEGMMRKDRQAVDQWSRSLVEECAERQREILDNLWKALRTGGFLIYSTCTFNREENEEIVDYLVETYGAKSVEIAIDASWGITGGIRTPHHCYRFLPHKLRGEGLFMAVLQKPGEEERVSIPPKTKDRCKGVKVGGEIEGRISKEGSDMTFLNDNDNTLVAFPTHHLPTLSALLKATEVIHYGTVVGEKTGKEFAPTQSLAMSTVLARDFFPRVELNHDTALEYLRRQALVLPQGTPSGYVLLTTDGYPLGFVKNIGNRANNLYPRQWRILSSY